MSGRTFVHHDGALGDVLLSLRALRAIRDDSGPIHLVARFDIAALLKDTGCVDETSSPGSIRYASLYGACPDAHLCSFLGRFERTVVFTVRAESPIAVSLKNIVPDVAVIVTIPPAGVRTHVSAFRARQFGRIGDSDVDELTVSGPMHENAAGLLARSCYESGRPLIALHPGSGGVAKCWPLEQYLGLVCRLQAEYNAFILMLAGPAESDALKERVASFARGRECTALVEGENLGIVAALLKLSDAYIGNDSGISHLAAAVGCKTIVLFGPTDPAVWSPLGSNVRVISARAGEPLSSITVEEALSAVHGFLDRSACT